MKFLVDECVGPKVSQWLIQLNYDTSSIYHDFRGMNDQLVLAKAVKENRVLITSDKDFGEMIFRKNMLHVGVIFLRLFDERASNKIIKLKWFLENYEKSVYKNFVVITENAVRIVKHQDN